MSYFKKVAAYGHKKAQYNIGIIYATKWYSKHSLKKAYSVFLDLAQEGYPKAQNRVGKHLLYGIGVEKDYKMALKWFENAYFKHKYKPAVCNLAVMFANGYGTIFNFGRAAKLARVGLEDNLPTCKKVYKEFKLEKYKEDKGFKIGYYE